MENKSPEVEAKEPVPQEESTGDAALDKRLATGVLQGDSGTEAAQVWISAFLIAALGFVVYLYAFSIPLHGDDLTLLGGNSPIGRIVTSLESLPDMPTAPLTVLGLSLNAVLGGGNIDVLHGGSILLHLLCAILVFLIARRLLPSGTSEAMAMIAGMLFVVHPLASEPVNYLVARPVLQSTFFGLAALLLLLRGCATQQRCVLCLAASVICFLLAFGSDSTALCFPFIGIGLLFYRCDKGSDTIDFRGVVAVLMILTTTFMWVAGMASGLLDASAAHHSLGEKFMGLVTQAGFGLYYGLLPTNYSILPVSIGLLPGIVALLLIALGIGLGVLGKRLPAILALWVLLALANTAFCGPEDAVGPTRYLYAPWAAVCILAPWALQFLRNPKARLVGGGVAAVLILGLAALSFQRCGLWTRPVEFWEAERVAHPDSLYPSLAIGEFLMLKTTTLETNSDAQRMVVKQAVTAWEDVLNRDPENVEAQKNLGILSLEQKEYVAALDHLRIASARHPRDQEVALYLASAAEQQARATNERSYVAEALRAFKRARKLAPLPNPIQERYGLLAAGTGDLETGLPLLELAAKNGRSEALAGALKQFHAMAEQRAKLRAQTAEVQQKSPQATAGLFLQAQQNLLEGRILGAFYLLQVGLQREPENTSAWMLLGHVSAQLDGADNFLAEWGSRQAGNGEAWKQLAIRCASVGNWSAAETYLRYGAQQPSANLPFPELILAAMAVDLKQAPRAVSYLQAAQQAYPDNPEAWLRMADLALAANDKSRARSLLNEAEKRGATPAALKERNDKLGPQNTVHKGITRTVIR